MLKVIILNRLLKVPLLFKRNKTFITVLNLFALYLIIILKDNKY